jgi:imidazolonepropionase-like amidohydrolase
MLLLRVRLAKRPLAGVPALWIAVAACFIYTLIGFQPARAADLVLMHARLYASPGVSPLDDATIVLRGGQIASVSRASAVPKGAEVLDCSGMSVTAGLWNSHIHLLPVKFLHADQKGGTELTTAFQEMLTGWGFTSVFDVASVLANTKNLRRRIEAGDILGPRILTTGEPFFPSDGVPVYVKSYLEENHIALPDDASTAAAVERVRAEVHDGADAIKIFAGSIQAHSVLMMQLDRAQAIVKEAHRLHRQVFEHPTNLAGVEIALASGVDVLAHVTSQLGEDWSPGLIARMRAQKMALIPTLMLFEVEAKKGGYSAEDAKKFADIAATRLRAFNAAGGEILFGTDVGYIYQFDTTEEYTLMQRAGMSFAQVLASLTTNPADRFGFGGHSGRVRKGMDGDLTVFNGDPGCNIAAFSRVRYTIRRGKVIFGEASADAAN